MLVMPFLIDDLCLNIEGDDDDNNNVAAGDDPESTLLPLKGTSNTNIHIAADTNNHILVLYSVMY